MALAIKFLSKGLAIVPDNFFTSSQLGRILWSNRTYLLGTIRKNRQGNPKHFVTESLQVGKIKFVSRHQETLMMLQARSTKRVILYSTEHHQPQVSANGKPKMINDYNATKFGVDIFDQMCDHRAYAPPARRWPLRLFMYLCDAAALNAYLLFKKIPDRRSFILELADQIMKEQKQRKSETKNWMNEGFNQIDEIYKSIHGKATGEEVAPNLHCYVCKKRGRGTNTQNRSKCENQICKVRTTQLLLCPNCNEPKKEDQLKVATTTGMRTINTPTSTTVTRCQKCTKNKNLRCSVCETPACKDHRSKKNPKHCLDCGRI